MLAEPAILLFCGLSFSFFFAASSSRCRTVDRHQIFIATCSMVTHIYKIRSEICPPPQKKMTDSKTSENFSLISDDFTTWSPIHCVPKKEATKLWAVTLSNLFTDFKNSFTDRLSRKFVMQRYVDIPPHLTYVATLPCETWITEKSTKFTVFQKTKPIHSSLNYG